MVLRACIHRAVVWRSLTPQSHRPVFVVYKNGERHGPRFGAHEALALALGHPSALYTCRNHGAHAMCTTSTQRSNAC